MRFAKGPAGLLHSRSRRRICAGREATAHGNGRRRYPASSESSISRQSPAARSQTDNVTVSEVSVSE